MENISLLEQRNHPELLCKRKASRVIRTMTTVLLPFSNCMKWLALFLKSSTSL